MKKYILFSLIGAIIIFIWQFISFPALNLHGAASEYTPLQSEILQKLQDSGLKEGMYLLGQPDPSKSREACEAEMKEYEGKPWAIINYQSNMSMDMATPMIRGFVVDFVIAWLLFWIFVQLKNPTLKNRLIISLAIGMIGFLFTPYTNFIWFKEPDIFAYLLDGIAPWLFLGLIGHKMAGTNKE